MLSKSAEDESMIYNRHGIIYNKGKGFFSWDDFRSTLKRILGADVEKKFVSKLLDRLDFDDMSRRNETDLDELNDTLMELGLAPAKTINEAKTKIKKKLATIGTTTQSVEQ
jgi:uncharacterized membrane-anchored protein